jgi:hypothetical protein
MRIPDAFIWVWRLLGETCNKCCREKRKLRCNRESLNRSQPGVSRAFNSVASLKAKGECCRSRVAAAIAGLRRLQSAAEIGRSAAHNLAKRTSESRRRAIAYRQTDLGDVQHSVFQKLPGHVDALNHKPFMRGLASG